MTNVMVSAASQPTLAKSARMGHPLFIMGKEEQTPEKAGPPARPVLTTKVFISQRPSGKLAQKQTRNAL